MGHGSGLHLQQCCIVHNWAAAAIFWLSGQPVDGLAVNCLSVHKQQTRTCIRLLAFSCCSRTAFVQLQTGASAQHEPNEF